MRYCTSSIMCRAPARRSLSNSETCRPASRARLLSTIGRNCLVSPTKVSWRAPLRRATKSSGSMACAASSASTKWKRSEANGASPAAEHVQQTTSTFCSASAYWRRCRRFRSARSSTESVYCLRSLCRAQSSVPACVQWSMSILGSSPTA